MRLTFSLARVWRRLLLCLLALPAVSLAAPAPDSGWLRDPGHPPVAVRLALSGAAVPAARQVDALLTVDLEADWKTYWRSPGEGGIAPSLDWSGSSNVSDVVWHWPAPRHYTLQGIETAGYQGRVEFPLQIVWDDNQQPVHFSATLTLPTCTTICVLTDFHFDMRFDPQQLAVDDARVHQFNRAMGAIPRALPGAGLRAAVFDDATGILEISLQRGEGWQQPKIFVDSAAEGLDEVQFAIDELSVSGEELRAQLTPGHWLELPELIGEPLTVTVVDADFTAEYSGSIQAGSLSPSASVSLLWIVPTALLGGLILNIMPCVFPVLGLKLRGLVVAGEYNSGRIRRQFAMSALGMVSAFWALAAGLLALQWAGQSIGWGVQFQNPWFIGVMALITFLFTLNLAGVFEWRLPSGLGTWAATRGDDSQAGHFLQGALATLLATPCTAPFLGTAVAYALGASPLVLFVVFTALGLGMALPWLVVALVPAVAKAMPRSGPWLGAVKPLFALLMGGTSLWLISLMAPFFGAAIVAAGMAALVLITIVLLGLKHGRRAVLLGIGCSCLAIALVAGAGAVSGKWRAPTAAPLQWEALDTATIDAATERGEVVFVDVTASWCITCQANKIGVLLREPTYSALQQAGVRRMQGDWTRPAEHISAYLKNNGSYGIPFNKVYGPAAPEGIQLPVLLTHEAVLDAIAAASTKQ